MNFKNYERWICEACGFIYDEAQGDPDSGLAPGTRFADIPEGWECPICGMRKSDLRLLKKSPPGDLQKTKHIKKLSRMNAMEGLNILLLLVQGLRGGQLQRTSDVWDPLHRFF